MLNSNGLHFFGYVISKLHVVDFEEMPKKDMFGFMSDIQIIAKVLHKVTGAIKIAFSTFMGKIEIYSRK